MAAGQGKPGNQRKVRDFDFLKNGNSQGISVRSM